MGPSGVATFGLRCGRVQSAGWARRIAVVVATSVAVLSLPLRGPVADATLLVREAGAFPGYTLVVPQTATETYLLDLNGRPVHTSRSDYLPGLSAAVREDGLLLRAGRLDPSPPNFASAPGGAGGVVELLDTLHPHLLSQRALSSIWVVTTRLRR